MILEFQNTIPLQAIGGALAIDGAVCLWFGAMGSSVDAISLLKNRQLK